MTQKELKRLSRADLLEMLLDQSEELQRLREEYDKACAALEQRRIVLDRAGSIAQAALQLNGVFEAAEASARQYLESLEAMSQLPEDWQANEEAQKLLEETRRKCEQMEADTRERCDRMLADAQAKAKFHRLEGQYRLRHLWKRK